MHLETRSIHVGREIDPTTGAVAPPIHLSTTFERDADGGFSRGYFYTRPDNPNRRALGQCLAALEGGADATAYASGTPACFAGSNLLRPGVYVIAPINAYLGTKK